MIEAICHRGPWLQGLQPTINGLKDCGMMLPDLLVHAILTFFIALKSEI